MKTSRVDLNLNCGVITTLTEYGISIVEKEIEENDYSGLLAKHYDKENGIIINLPFWKFVKIFGPYIYHQMIEIPFVSNSITIVDYEDKCREEISAGSPHNTNVK